MSLKKIKRIAVCYPQIPFTRGGAENLVESLVDELRDREYDVELVSIPFKWYPRKQLWNDTQQWERIDLREANGKSIDCVIATVFPSYFINHPRKSVWLVHQLRQIYDLYGTAYSDFSSISFSDQLLRKRLVAQDTKKLGTFRNIYTIADNVSCRLRKYNGIDSITLYPPPKIASNLFSGPYDDYVLFVGRLDKMKRAELLLDALRYCAPQIKCKIVGVGPEENVLREWVAGHDLSHRVEFLGAVDDDILVELYARCFAVFFVPFDEDYGYVTVEAFFAKRPVITANDSGGPLEFVEDNYNGFVISPDDPQSSAKKIEELYYDKNKCREFGEHGFKKVCQINWDTIIDKLVCCHQ